MDITDALVLIIDDNPENIQLLGSTLQEHNYSVAFASSGFEALEFMAEEIPDLVLLDVMMPDMDGFEVLGQMKEDPRFINVPVILLTALNDKENKLRGFRAGAVDFVSKPFLREEVLARIQVHVSLSKAVRRLEEMAITDTLTKTYNRRFAYEILNKHIKRAEREKGSFSICYVDIDDLKKMNDTNGHQAGDDLIIAISLEIMKNIRESDFVFRMGGDEFLILFTSTPIDEVEPVILRIKNGLKECRIHDILPDFSYGIIGIDWENPVSVKELLAAGDHRMYENKKSKKGARHEKEREGDNSLQ